MDFFTLGDFTCVVGVCSKRPISFCSWARVIGRDFAFVCNSGVQEIHETILIDRHDCRPAVDPILAGNSSIWIGYHRESELVLAGDLGCALGILSVADGDDDNPSFACLTRQVPQSTELHQARCRAGFPKDEQHTPAS